MALGPTDGSLCGHRGLGPSAGGKLMALTMTRTRTQTTLTRLVEQLARINRELEMLREAH